MRDVLPLGLQLMQFARHNWRNTSDIADLRQEVYVHACSMMRRSGKIPDSAVQFVFRTARNLLTDRMRREHVVPIEAAADMDALEIAVDEPSQDRMLAMARDELQQLLNRRSKLLPPRCREAFVVRRVEGLTDDQIAARMGISVTTVTPEHLCKQALHSRRCAEHRGARVAEEEKIERRGKHLQARSMRAQRRGSSGATFPIRATSEQVEFNSWLARIACASREAVMLEAVWQRTERLARVARVDRGTGRACTRRSCFSLLHEINGRVCDCRGVEYFRPTASATARENLPNNCGRS